MFTSLHLYSCCDFDVADGLTTIRQLVTVTVLEWILCASLALATGAAAAAAVECVAVTAAFMQHSALYWSFILRQQFTVWLPGQG